MSCVLSRAPGRKTRPNVKTAQIHILSEKDTELTWATPERARPRSAGIRHVSTSERRGSRTIRRTNNHSRSPAADASPRRRMERSCPSLNGSVECEKRYNRSMAPNSEWPGAIFLVSRHRRSRRGRRSGGGSGAGAAGERRNQRPARSPSLIPMGSLRSAIMPEVVDASDAAPHGFGSRARPADDPASTASGPICRR
jgi:hypothetical protein